MTELEHKYGKNIHILNDCYLTTILSQLGAPETFQPKLNSLITFAYRRLIETIVNREFDKKLFEVATRMTSIYPQQKFRGNLIDSTQKVVCVNLARAGTVPSHVCYEHLNYLLDPEGVRQDHVFAARMTDSKDQVTGTQLGNSKIGGGIDDAIVIFPDPMGATGNTLVSSLDYYKKKISGQAKKFIAIHLVVTPEYIKNVTQAHPDLVVYAIRLDRGLSSQKALDATPGEYWSEEKGLDHRQYIVPGAGGLGEVLNNSFV